VAINIESIHSHREMIHTYDSFGRSVAELALHAAEQQVKGEQEASKVQLFAVVEATSKGCHRIKVCHDSPLGPVCVWVHIN